MASAASGFLLGDGAMASAASGAAGTAAGYYMLKYIGKPLCDPAASLDVFVATAQHVTDPQTASTAADAHTSRRMALHFAQNVLNVSMQELEASFAAGIVLDEPSSRASELVKHCPPAPSFRPTAGPNPATAALESTAAHAHAMAHSASFVRHAQPCAERTRTTAARQQRAGECNDAKAYCGLACLEPRV